MSQVGLRGLSRLLRELDRVTRRVIGDDTEFLRLQDRERVGKLELRVLLGPCALLVIRVALLLLLLNLFQFLLLLVLRDLVKDLQVLQN